MRKCDNCNNGSYGLDCNSGVETLYCRESEYEFEVEPNGLCDSHQFIDGMSNEKNYVLYDKNYIGEGYFVVHTKNGEITEFLKLYIMNNDGFPHYGLRVFSVDGKDNPDEEFNRIEFTFRSVEDYDNRLFEAFSAFSKNVHKSIYTIDEHQQGRNGISISTDNGIVKFVVSKDIYHGKQHPTDFIDINLGDNYSCENYEAINTLYNSLRMTCPQKATKEDINKIKTLKIK